MNGNLKDHGCAPCISPIWCREVSGNVCLQWAEVWLGDDVKLLLLWNPAKSTIINDWVQPPKSLLNLSVSISTLYHPSLSHFHLSPQPHNWSTHFTLLLSNSCLTHACNPSIASHHLQFVFNGSHILTTPVPPLSLAKSICSLVFASVTVKLFEKDDIQGSTWFHAAISAAYSVVESLGIFFSLLGTTLTSLRTSLALLSVLSDPYSFFRLHTPPFVSSICPSVISSISTTTYFPVLFLQLCTQMSIFIATLSAVAEETTSLIL